MGYTRDTPILSRGRLTADEINAAFAARNAGAPPEIGPAVVATCGATGVNGDFLAAEIGNETGWWTSRYATERNNPSGFGAVDSDPDLANSFDSIEAGIRATCAHWLSYVLGDKNPLAGEDPRYGPVSTSPHFGRVHAIGDIGNGVWASSPVYADSLLGILGEIAPDGPADDAPAPLPDPPIGGHVDIIDVRDQLPTGNGGSHQTFFPKKGAIVHYTGPAVNLDADEMAALISYANFHMGPYLGEGGIAYHYSVAYDGTVRLLRDPEAVLWHCGAWPENASHYAIHCQLGEGQNASPEQLASLTALVDQLANQDGFGRDQVKGHREVSSTACPGTLMDDFVYPYRRGDMQVSDRVNFNETGHGIDGAIRRHFEHNGGVVVLGYPVSEVVNDPWGATNPDGSPMQVQFFQRTILEIHPENQVPNDVQGRLLGAQAAKAAGLSGPGID